MSNRLVRYPWIIRHPYKVEYFDRTKDGAYLATFGPVYDGHIYAEISTPCEIYSGVICVEGVELETAEDYKKLLDDLGYY